MPPQPPSFGSQQYWDNRFTSNSNPFEWLEAPTALDPYLVTALSETRDQHPEILHIGCGTSLLSYHLRAHVKDPEQIHNLDYSDVAIVIGKKRETDIFNVGQNQEEGNGTSDETGSKNTAPVSNGNAQPTKPVISQESSNDSSSTACMRWSAANLLSHISLLSVCKPSTYSIIVDKSTSDSIACSDDVYVPLPYHISTSANTASKPQLTQSPEPIHPLHILAIHLALLTKPKARWISLSYSMDRYPFLHIPPLETTELGSKAATASASTAEVDGFDDVLDGDLDDIPQTVIDSGLPDPGTLWNLQGKYEIEVPSKETLDESTGTTTTHRPRVLHWVYVLERTEVEVFARDH